MDTSGEWRPITIKTYTKLLTNEMRSMVLVYLLINYQKKKVYFLIYIYAGTWIEKGNLMVSKVNFTDDFCNFRN